jgi:hypothetical protein
VVPASVRPGRRTTTHHRRGRQAPPCSGRHPAVLAPPGHWPAQLPPRPARPLPLRRPPELDRRPAQPGRSRPLRPARRRPGLAHPDLLPGPLSARHRGSSPASSGLVGAGSAAGAALRPAAPADPRGGNCHRGGRKQTRLGNPQDPRPPLGAAAALLVDELAPAHRGQPAQGRAGLPVTAGRGAAGPQRPGRLVRRRQGHRGARAHAAPAPAHRGVTGDQRQAPT